MSPTVLLRSQLAYTMECREESGKEVKGEGPGSQTHTANATM
jgi:hypothetical protein